MKKIVHNYDEGLNWIDVIAEARGGEITGNFVKGDNEIYSGTHFVLQIEKNISAFLVDAKYNQDVLTEYNYGNSSFIGMYFYLTNSVIDFELDKKSSLLGKLDYNLGIVDSNLSTYYTIKKNTKIFAVCIFINKVTILNYFRKSAEQELITNMFFDENNKIVHLERMSIDSLILINDFRKIPPESSLYDMYFKGLVYALIGDYLKNMDKNLIDKKLTIDAKSIIASKAMLLNLIEGPFPGVDFLASQVAMSRSKYKKLFVMMSGVNPGVYFYNNKLNRAKELLETGKFTVNEVADKLSYANVSYLGKRFYEKYGVFPKEYQSLF